MKVLAVDDMRKLIRKVGINKFLSQVIQSLETDFSNWDSFLKSPRHATHFPHGVIELMPCSDQELYSFKYVNGHPRNTREGKLSVIAVGMLANVADGYPMLLCEMTLLTALRTAAVTALGAKYLAREDSVTLAIIGSGAQAEFQVLAAALVRPVRYVRFIDTDPAAMSKFARNLADYDFTLEPCASIAEAMSGADMVITATAAKQKAVVLTADMITPGMHIHGLGGDCPGKTELDPAILPRCRIVVEYLSQSRLEGEIQNLPDPANCTELWELVAGTRPGRESATQVTLLDSVGFALEDHSILKLVYELSERLGIGRPLALIPDLADPKDLFGSLAGSGEAVATGLKSR